MKLAIRNEVTPDSHPPGDQVSFERAVHTNQNEHCIFDVLRQSKQLSVGLVTLPEGTVGGAGHRTSD